MKSIKALLAGGLIAIVIAAFLLWLLNSSPIAVVKNASVVPVTVQLETDVGESYSTGTIAAGDSVRVTITRRDKLLWAVAKFPDGHVKQSPKIYTTTQGTVSALVTNEAVEISYAL